MTEAIARDVLRQYFRVLKKDPNIEKPQTVIDAEEILGKELVNDIKKIVDNE